MFPAMIATTEERPWGRFTTVLDSDRFKVKTIEILPKQRLSLQSHSYRSEHWVLVEGSATALVDGQESQMEEGSYIYIPKGSQHRLTNPHESNVTVLIEVQYGSQVSETDIWRYEDDYFRA